MHWKGKAEFNFYRSLEKRQQISLDYLRNLVTAIGERTAIVDACVSPRLVTELRSLGLDAIWVPAVLGDGVSDEEIQRLLLSKGQRVLLTQDVKFFRKMGQDAILLHRFKEKWGMKTKESTRMGIQPKRSFQNPYCYSLVKNTPDVGQITRHG